MNRTYSIEYIDDEGCSVIKHLIASREEAERLMVAMSAEFSGIVFNDLTPPQTLTTVKLLK